MSGESRDTRTYVEIDGREYLLGHDRDLVEIMSKIEAAARSEPTFIDLSDGYRLVSVLVSPQSRVVITVRHEAPAHAQSAPPGGSLSDWDL